MDGKENGPDVISVTQKDIDAPGNPIANAVKRTFQAYQVFVGTAFCCYVPKRRQEEVVLVLDDAAQEAFRAIANGKKIEPFSFPVVYYGESTVYES